MTTPGISRVIFTLTEVPSPPKRCLTGISSPEKQQHHHHHQQQQGLLKLNINRRNAALLALMSIFPSLSKPAPANAFSIGISGPKDWLRDQKRKASKFLLAPIDASRDSLRNAQLLLSTSGSDSPNEDSEEVQRLLRSATRDCVPQERNSFVSFQASTGVEVCTFRLIVKNAASLLDDRDPVKLEAESMLQNLVSSFTSLQGVANDANLQLASNRQKVADALIDTMLSLDKFEQGIKDCLDV